MTRNAMLLCGLLLLASCEQNDTPRTRADAVTAKPVATGTPSARPPIAKHASAKPSAAAATASANTTSSASATSSAAAAASAPVAPVTTLTAIAKAGKLKLRRLSPTGGVDASATVDDPEKVRALLAAIGIAQVAVDACPRCIPSVQITFEDAFGTRLGSLGLFCSDQLDKPTVAALRDALANTCETLTIAAPKALHRLIDEALGSRPAAKE